MRLPEFVNCVLKLSSLQFMGSSGHKRGVTRAILSDDLFKFFVGHLFVIRLGHWAPNGYELSRPHSGIGSSKCYASPVYPQTPIRGELTTGNNISSPQS